MGTFKRGFRLINEKNKLNKSQEQKNVAMVFLKQPIPVIACFKQFWVINICTPAEPRDETLKKIKYIFECLPYPNYSIAQDKMTTQWKRIDSGFCSLDNCAKRRASRHF